MTDQSAPPPPKLRRVSHIPRFTTMRAITALMLREMSTTYGRSPIGYLTALMEPVLGVFIMVAIFSTGFRNPPLGTDFSIFFASGFLPFNMALAISRKVATAIPFNGTLLTYTRITYVDAILARFILATITHIVISFIVFGVILTVFETRTVMRVDALLQAYLMAMAIGLGLGLANAVLVARFPLWNLIWSTISRPLVLISGVIFLHEKIPNPYREWLEWNPLVHVVSGARHAFYYSYVADYVDPVYVYFVAGALSTVGLFFLRRYYRDFLER